MKTEEAGSGKDRLNFRKGQQRGPSGGGKVGRAECAQTGSASEHV